jgi:hypothetical protein
MKRRGGWAILAGLAVVAPARAFLGVGDTSFVTVIANPAEAANWASELDQLNRQLAAATGTLGTLEQLRAYAGDPRLAAAALPDLAGLRQGVGAATGGSATATDLAAAWQALGPVGQAQAAANLLAAAGAGGTMTVFGQATARNPALYRNAASDTMQTAQVRAQVASEQAARATLAGQLAEAWARFRVAATTSAQQAILTEIGQLQAQDQVMAEHRQALLADRELADREGRDQARVQLTAADEARLAESALLRAAAAGRAQAAETQRLATVQKRPPAPAAADYSGLRLWTPADAAGGSP